MSLILAALLSAPPGIDWFEIKGSRDQANINWKGWPKLLKVGMVEAAKEGKPVLLLAGDWT